MSRMQSRRGNRHLLNPLPDRAGARPGKDRMDPMHHDRVPMGLSRPGRRALALAMLAMTGMLVPMLTLLQGCDGDRLNSVNDLLYQESNGSMAITVADSFGAPVADASVSMGFTQARTDSHGRARITGFRDGLSAVHVSADGFSPAGVSFEVFRGRETEISLAMKRAPSAFKAALYFPVGSGNSWSFTSPGAAGVTIDWKVDSTVLFGDRRRAELVLGPRRTLWIEVDRGIRISGDGDGDFVAGSETMAFDDTAPGSRIASSYRDHKGLTHRVVWHWQASEDISTDAGIFKDCLRARRSETVEGPGADLTVRDETLWFARGVGIVMGRNLDSEFSDPLFLENGRLADFNR